MICEGFSVCAKINFIKVGMCFQSKRDHFKQKPQAINNKTACIVLKGWCICILLFFFANFFSPFQAHETVQLFWKKRGSACKHQIAWDHIICKWLAWNLQSGQYQSEYQKVCTTIAIYTHTFFSMIAERRNDTHKCTRAARETHFMQII